MIIELFQMNRYLSFGFAFLFSGVGYFGINNILTLSSNLTTASIMLSFEILFKDTYFQKNYHYSHDIDHPSLNFYNIPLV